MLSKRRVHNHNGERRRNRQPTVHTKFQISQNLAQFQVRLGEMGRKPKIDKPKETNAGRDHWDYAQFVIAAGGGFNRGCVVGATDKHGEQVTDKFYKIESFGRTLYHLLGIDADTLVHTPANRPVKLIVEDAPIIKEAIS